MNTLFIDTHDKDIVLALYKDEILLDSNVKTSERNHSDYTMPMIKELLDRNKVTIHDISQILVINGPGSFTGVRLGVTIAKTLAYTLNIPIKTMSSLEMYAVSEETSTTKVITINDIKGVFVGMFTSYNEQIGDFFYKSNNEFELFIKENNLQDNIIDTKKINFDKIFQQFKHKEVELAHKVNPIYIKVIEVLKK